MSAHWFCAAPSYPTSGAQQRLFVLVCFQCCERRRCRMRRLVSPPLRRHSRLVYATRRIAFGRHCRGCLSVDLLQMAADDIDHFRIRVGRSRSRGTRVNPGTRTFVGSTLRSARRVEDPNRFGGIAGKGGGASTHSRSLARLAGDGECPNGALAGIQEDGQAADKLQFFGYRKPRIPTKSLFHNFGSNPLRA